MKSFKFDSYAMFSNQYIEKYTDEQIKNEPMLFSCDKTAALSLGGPLTKDFMSKLEPFLHNNEEIILDSRVHMSFAPGIYLGIPGYHHDDIPRTTIDKQPNYSDVEPKAQHCMAVVNAEIAPTEFALGEASFPDIEVGEQYYEKWHPIVENYIAYGQLKSVLVKDRQLVMFDAHA